MAEWDPVQSVPLTPGVPRITVNPKSTMTPAPPSNAWEPVAQMPMMSAGSGTKPAVDPWAPVDQKPVSPPAPATGEGQSGGLVANALKPFTDYPSTYARKNLEAREQMGRGVEQIKEGGGIGQYAKGAANVGLGAVGYIASPIEAGIESIAGAPIERITGLPKEYTDFAIGLALPGIGLAKMPGTPKTWPGPARAAEKILSPETVAPEAQEAAGLIRQHTGEAARATEVTGSQLESYYPAVNKLPQPDQWNIQNYIDGGRTAITPPTPELRSLADTLRDAFQVRKKQLQSLPDFAQKAFRDEYFPHLWQDPAAAQGTVSQSRGGISRQGSGASLKARTIPTFEDGLKAGLKPVYDNPIDASMRYIMSMDKFIAANKILQEAKNAGTVISVDKKVVGASGHPNSMAGVPPGYVELKGRGGQGWAAPEAWARVYNNWVSQGFEQSKNFGPIYEGTRKFTNGMMQSLLGFSGYHAFTMAEASMATEMSRAVGGAHGLKAGQVLRGAGGYLTSPVRYAYRGKKFKDIYLNKAVNVRPEDKELVDLLTQAGGRFAGTKHTFDLQASAMGDYLTSFRRAQLRSQMAEHAKQIKAAPLTGTAKFALSTMARTLETFNKPLFQHYIPSIKNGAQTELMGDFLRANPGASQAEKLSAARRIVDSVDNRFGEMIQDNIFWNKMFKQSAQLAMLSYSWNVGAFREIGGGVRDVARSAVGRGAWTPKADYVVSTALNWAILSSIYQYAKTGKKPTDTDTPLQDLMAPRTGGTDARTGLPERIIVPGIMKDVFGYYENVTQEASNKLNPGIKTAWQVLSNADYRGDPIFEPKPEGTSTAEQVPTWLGNLIEHVAKNGMPITMQNVEKREPGSALSTPERMIGVRTAPRYLVDPEGTAAMKRKIDSTRWYGRKGRGGRLGHERTEKARYGGTQ